MSGTLAVSRTPSCMGSPSRSCRLVVRPDPPGDTELTWNMDKVSGGLRCSFQGGKIRWKNFLLALIVFLAMRIVSSVSGGLRG